MPPMPEKREPTVTLPIPAMSRSCHKSARQNRGATMPGLREGAETSCLIWTLLIDRDAEHVVRPAFRWLMVRVRVAAEVDRELLVCANSPRVDDPVRALDGKLDLLAHLRRA